MCPPGGMSWRRAVALGKRRVSWPELPTLSRVRYPPDRVVRARRTRLPVRNAAYGRVGGDQGEVAGHGSRRCYRDDAVRAVGPSNGHLDGQIERGRGTWAGQCADRREQPLADGLGSPAAQFLEELGQGRPVFGAWGQASPQGFLDGGRHALQPRVRSGQAALRRPADTRGSTR